MALAVAIALLPSASARAHVIRGGLVPRPMAQRNGLQRAWFTHVQLDPSRDRVIDLVQHDGTLFALTDRSGVHVIDAETGRTLWTAQIGRMDRPTLGIAANDQYVAVVNGSTLYLVDRSTGRPVWEEPLGGGPGAGPALSDDRVFVPLVTGVLESYKFKPDGRFPWQYHAGGRTLVRPVTTHTSIAWPNEDGISYIGSLDPLEIHSRLETRKPVANRPAYQPPHLFFVSLDGYVYAVHESEGDLVWSYSTGDPITERPVAVDGRVYVCAESGGMFCLDAATGQRAWWTPHMARFIAASRTRIYALDRLGRLVILDKQTGAPLSAMETQSLSLFLTNEKTDRIYLGTTDGVLQCLHEIGQEEPLDYTPPEPAPVQPPEAAAAAPGAAPDGTAPPAEAPPAQAPPALPPATPPPATPPPAEPPPAADPDNPFGEDDPFGENPFDF
ncbi:MAG: PQQ-binding-like beta-propeller repeat protein [Pirellulales bacterium]